MLITNNHNLVKICAVLLFVLLSTFLLYGPYWPIVRSLYLEYRSHQGVRSIPILIEALNDNNELSSRTAVGQLVKLKDHSVHSLSEVLFNQQQPELKRARAAECLGLIGIHTEDSLLAIELGSSDKNEYVRVQSLRAAWRLENNAENVIPGLISLLKSTEYRVVYVAIEALSEIGPLAKSAIPPLNELRKSNPVYDLNATDAIHSIKEGK